MEKKKKVFPVSSHWRFGLDSGVESWFSPQTSPALGYANYRCSMSWAWNRFGIFVAHMQLHRISFLLLGHFAPPFSGIERYVTIAFRPARFHNSLYEHCPLELCKTLILIPLQWGHSYNCLQQQWLCSAGCSILLFFSYHLVQVK